MSREIEFRAWHNEANEYCDGTTSNMFRWAEDGQPVTLEQFTGLHDCKGVKIYAGDIVQSYHFTDENRKDHFLSHIVKWSDKFNGWFMLNGKDLSGNDGSIQMWVYMKSSKYTAKVIGNIHQNSELLK